MEKRRQGGKRRLHAFRAMGVLTNDQARVKLAMGISNRK